MAGGTILAAGPPRPGARLAPSRASLNLGGGFHHAFADRGERFCAFNDVAVAIAEPCAPSGSPAPVLVVDLDLHDGDGTRAIFARDPRVHTFSIHNRTRRRRPGRRAGRVDLGRAAAAGSRTRRTSRRSRSTCRRSSRRPPRPSSSTWPAATRRPTTRSATGRSSPAGLLERDHTSSPGARGRAPGAAPLVIALAGGYGLAGLALQRPLPRPCSIRGRPFEPPSTEELTLAATAAWRGASPRAIDWRWGRRRGGDGAAAAGPTTGARPPTTSPAVRRQRARSRFLGYYSQQGLELTLERAGLLDRLRRAGFAHPHPRARPRQPGRRDPAAVRRRAGGRDC